MLAMRNVWFVTLILAMLLTLPQAVPADPPVQATKSAKELSAHAQRECDLGRRAQDRAQRLAHFQQGQTLAEQAVALDDQVASAHFALFCSLGEQMRIDGETLSSVFGLMRVMKVLDRTLELDPVHLNAMSSKGTFLVRLPAIMGGDQQKGEQMLREVIRRAPHAVNARLALAKSCADRGNYQEAVALATQALEIAKAEAREDMIPEAQTVMAELRAQFPSTMVARP
ncbi:MAG: hypothetical protein ACREI3_08630 [Nitrospirales bacterium]